MNTRHTLRWAAAAIAALAASGVHAIEAVQWDPAENAMTLSGGPVNTDGTREPGAWTVGRGEATEFHDGIARDTMSSRADVRQELAQARQRGWLADTGEAGATERVWQRRALFVASERDRELASVKASADPIGEIAAMETRPPVDHGSMYALAADDTALRVPSNQAPQTPAPDQSSIAIAPLAGDRRHHDLMLAEAPRFVDDGSGLLADSTTVETR